jgi:hypothetical protein
MFGEIVRRGHGVAVFVPDAAIVGRINFNVGDPDFFNDQQGIDFADRNVFFDQQHTLLIINIDTGFNNPASADNVNESIHVHKALPDNFAEIKAFYFGEFIEVVPTDANLPLHIIFSYRVYRLNCDKSLAVIAWSPKRRFCFCEEPS